MIRDDDESKRDGPQEITSNDEDYQWMAPIKLIPGIWERAYFIRRSKNEGDELVCIKYDEIREDVDCASLYKQKDKILVVQLNHERHPTRNENKIYLQGGQFLIIDQSYTLRVLEYENKRRQTADPSLMVVSSISLVDFSIKRLMRALDLMPWSSCVITSNSLISGRVQLVNKIDETH